MQAALTALDPLISRSGEAPILLNGLLVPWALGKHSLSEPLWEQTSLLVPGELHPRN